MSTPLQVKARRFYDNENESGWVRVKNLYKDIWNGVERSELIFVGQTFFYSFVGGAVWRSMFGSTQILQEFHVRHNAAIFLGKSDVKKQLLLFTVEQICNRGFNFGLKCAAFSTFCAFVCMHSLVYRRDFSTLDFSATIGLAYGLTRYNRGLRAIGSATVLGLASGLFGACMIKSVMWARDLKVKDWLDEMNVELNRANFVPVDEDDKESE